MHGIEIGDANILIIVFHINQLSEYGYHRVDCAPVRVPLNVAPVKIVQ